MQPNVESLIEAARRLPPADRQRLAEALAERGSSLPIHRITEIRGVGKDLWRGEDPQDYVNSERDAWEN
ncbi:MAG TPA: hypothetical protein PLK77_06310 [Pyrinomonadaceae bacterium]|nr:hypothetical protein [Pyrinomonadaceae bacterium]